MRWKLGNSALYRMKNSRFLIQSAGTISKVMLDRKWKLVQKLVQNFKRSTWKFPQWNNLNIWKFLVLLLLDHLLNLTHSIWSNFAKGRFTDQCTLRTYFPDLSTCSKQDFRSIMLLTYREKLCAHYDQIQAIYHGFFLSHYWWNLKRESITKAAGLELWHLKANVPCQSKIVNLIDCPGKHPEKLLNELLDAIKVVQIQRNLLS